MKTLKIEFDNETVFENFCSWLCNHGEDDYWDWMSECELNEEGDITVIDFRYHGIEDETKATNDPTRYGTFMCDDTIRTTCGRLKK